MTLNDAITELNAEYGCTVQDRTCLVLIHYLSCTLLVLAACSSWNRARTMSFDDEDDSILHVQYIDKASVSIPLHFRSSSWTTVTSRSWRALSLMTHEKSRVNIDSRICRKETIVDRSLRKIWSATPYIYQSWVKSIGVEMMVITLLSSEIINYKRENRASAANGIVSVDLSNKIRVSHTRTFNVLPNPTQMTWNRIRLWYFYGSLFAPQSVICVVRAWIQRVWWMCWREICEFSPLEMNLPFFFIQRWGRQRK